MRIVDKTKLSSEALQKRNTATGEEEKPINIKTQQKQSLSTSPKSPSLDSLTAYAPYFTYNDRIPTSPSRIDQPSFRTTSSEAASHSKLKNDQVSASESQLFGDKVSTHEQYRFPTNPSFNSAAQKSATLGGSLSNLQKKPNNGSKESINSDKTPATVSPFIKRSSTPGNNESFATSTTPYHTVRNNTSASQDNIFSIAKKSSTQIESQGGTTSKSQDNITSKRTSSSSNHEISQTAGSQRVSNNIGSSTGNQSLGEDRRKTNAIQEETSTGTISKSAEKITDVPYVHEFVDSSGPSQENLPIARKQPPSNNSAVATHRRSNSSLNESKRESISSHSNRNSAASNSSPRESLIIQTGSRRDSSHGLAAAPFYAASISRDSSPAGGRKVIHSTTVDESSNIIVKSINNPSISRTSTYQSSEEKQKSNTLTPPTVPSKYGSMRKDPAKELQPGINVSSKRESFKQVSSPTTPSSTLNRASFSASSTSARRATQTELGTKISNFSAPTSPINPTSPNYPSSPGNNIKGVSDLNLHGASSGESLHKSPSNSDWNILSQAKRISLQRQPFSLSDAKLSGQVSQSNSSINSILRRNSVLKRQANTSESNIPGRGSQSVQFNATSEGNLTTTSNSHNDISGSTNSITATIASSTSSKRTAISHLVEKAERNYQRPSTSDSHLAGMSPLKLAISQPMGNAASDNQSPTTLSSNHSSTASSTRKLKTKSLIGDRKFPNLFSMLSSETPAVGSSGGSISNRSVTTGAERSDEKRLLSSRSSTDDPDQIHNVRISISTTAENYDYPNDKDEVMSKFEEKMSKRGSREPGFAISKLLTRMLTVYKLSIKALMQMNNTKLALIQSNFSVDEEKLVDYRLGKYLDEHDDIMKVYEKLNDLVVDHIERLKKQKTHSASTSA